MIKTLLIYFTFFLAAVFVYMVIGAFILELFILLLKIFRKNKFVIFFVDKFLVKEDFKHPKFELILRSTIFWPILTAVYIIIFPTILFVFVCERIFNRFEDINDSIEDIDINNKKGDE
jgi:hypothetical protein